MPRCTPGVTSRERAVQIFYFCFVFEGTGSNLALVQFVASFPRCFSSSRVPAIIRKKGREYYFGFKMIQAHCSARDHLVQARIFWIHAGLVCTSIATSHMALPCSSLALSMIDTISYFAASSSRGNARLCRMTGRMYSSAQMDTRLQTHDKRRLPRCRFLTATNNRISGKRKLWLYNQSTDTVSPRFWICIFISFLFCHV